MNHTLSRRMLLAGGAAALLAPLAAHGQAFPSKPITLIVPWPAGGSTDRHLRTLAEIASKHLGQPIIIENKPGGGGTLGPGTMACTAKPDGYTIAQFPMGMLRIPHMQKTAWDPIKDFTFIIGVTGYTFGFVVRADSPYKTFKDYIEAARKARARSTTAPPAPAPAAPADGGGGDVPRCSSTTSRSRATPT
jgi:tripartite-type tricarboxylate transporter receptor subunit TctC